MAQHGPDRRADLLRERLAAEGLASYADAICSQLDELYMQRDERSLTRLLKDAGVVKLGHRQKAAGLILAVGGIQEQRGGEGGGAAANPIASGRTSVAGTGASQSGEAAGADFWAGVVASSLESTAAGALDACDVRFALSEAPAASTSHVVDPLQRQRQERESAAGSISTGESENRNGTTDGECVPAERERSSYQGGIQEDRADVCRQRGNAAFERRDLAASGRWYEKALEARPGDPVALNNLAACSLMASPPRPAEALRRLEPLLSQTSACGALNNKARLRAGRACLMLGRLQESLSHFDAAVAIDKRIAAKEAGGGANAEPRWAPPADEAGAGVTELKRLGGPRAVSEVSDAREGRAKASKLLSHASRARALSEQGRPDEALYLARAVARECTHGSIGTELVLSILERSGRLWEAQREAEEAIEAMRYRAGGEGVESAMRCRGGDAADEAVRALRLAHARVLSLRGRVDEAEAMLAELVAQRPDDARAASQLHQIRAGLNARTRGNAAYAAGDYGGAATAYTEGLAADTSGMLRGLLRGNRAQARLQAGWYAEALSDVDSALEFDPTSVKLLLRRAACLQHLGRLDQARDAFVRALEQEPECAAAAAGLRDCDERMRRGGRAKACGGTSSEAGENHVAPSEPQLDPYAELDLALDATAAQIKQAFRKAALRWHPDKSAAKLGLDDEGRAEAEARFRRINAANDVLSDPVKKRQYDLGGGIGGAARAAPAYSSAF
jgi:tetratricopeptide (TPR) repeat protein